MDLKASMIPHEELPEFCPTLSRDPTYQWTETDHHEGKISANLFKHNVTKNEKISQTTKP